MTDPSAYAPDPNHVPRPGRPPAERDSQIPEESESSPGSAEAPESSPGSAEERTVDKPSTAGEPSSAEEQATDDERMAPDEAVADTRPSQRDVHALTIPTAAGGDRRADPPAEAVDPDPRHRGDVGDERGPGVTAGRAD